MDEQNTNIRILLTLKANTALDDLIKNFNLEETAEESLKKTNEGKPSNVVVISQLAKDFVAQKVLEKDLAPSLQKDLGVSQLTAEQIAKEMLSKIIPFVEKFPEANFQDPILAEKIIEKVLGEKPQSTQEAPTEDNPLSFVQRPPAMTVEENEKLLREERAPIATMMPPDAGAEDLKSSIKKAKKTLATEKDNNVLLTPKRPRGTDTYREPVE